MNFNVSDYSLIRCDIQVFTETMQPYKLAQVHDYRGINHTDLLHDLYEQFCLSYFSTTMDTAIDQYNNSI